jgi:hypothetical protein
MVIMQISTLVSVEGSSLAGRSLGEKHFPIYFSKVLETQDEEFIVWDFEGVSHASASYLSATVGALLGMANSGLLNRYFAFSGVERDTMDDLQIILSTEGLVSFEVLRFEPLEIRRIGARLDEVFERTFALLEQRGPSSAEDLMSGTGEKIVKTAWLNRLNQLHRMRLARRTKENREFIFLPAYKTWEVVYG